MSEELDNIIDEDDSEQFTERPVFLTVLCVLTFIGSGLSILMNITGVLSEAKSTMVNGVEMAPGEFDKVWAAMSLVAALISLFGAIKLIGQHKIGLSIYISGVGLTIISWILSGVYMTADIDKVPGGRQATWIVIMLMIVVNVAFIIMYYVNRKALR